jgi:hypothetical protein
MVGNSLLLATLATGLFAGAALHVTLVEHPARLETGTSGAVAEWRPSFRRGTMLAAPLAVIAALAGLWCWAGSAGSGWLVTGVAMAGVVLFTLVVIRPVNERLSDARLDTGSAEAFELLQRWGTLHAVRTIVALAAFTIDLAMLLG